MNAVISLIKSGLSQGVSHKELLVKVVITKICTTLVPLLLWLNIFEYTGITQYEGWGRLDFCGYYFLTLVITTLTQVDFHTEFSALVREGRLTQWILRPISSFEFGSGVIISRMILLVLPLIIISAVFLFIVPEWLDFVKINFEGILVIGAGLVILSLLNILIGLLSFWLLHTEGIFSGIYIILFFFGGMLIPLDFLPDILNMIGGFLPLQYAVYLPVVFTLNLNPISFDSIVLGQLLWCGILLVAIYILLFLGLKRYDAVGN